MTETPAECSEECRWSEDPPCSYWVWHKKKAGQYAKQCILIEKKARVWTFADKWAISGSPWGNCKAIRGTRHKAK